MELSERILRLLGKRDDDPALIQFLEEFKPYLHSYAYELLKLYNFSGLGFSLFYNGTAGCIERVSFHIFTNRVATERCQPFEGVLPFAIPTRSTRAEVQKILGVAPSEQTNLHSWHDRYQISHWTIDCTFSAPEGLLKFVSATSNEIVPLQNQSEIDAMLWRTCMSCGEKHDAASRFVIESNEVSVCHICVDGFVNQFRERRDRFDQRAGCSLCAHKLSRKNSTLRVIEKQNMSICEICAEELQEGLSRFVDFDRLVNKIAEPDMHFPDFEPNLDFQ